jgi:hypothetical protein
MAVDENTGAGQAPALKPLGEPIPRRTYRLPEERARAVGARSDDVWLETSWWKFEVHLSARVADKSADFLELITEVCALALPFPLDEIVGKFAELRTKWIKSVAGGGGCKLVSPWIWPAMLIPIGKPDTSLYWMTYREGVGWSEREKMPEQKSRENPALALFQDKMYCVYRDDRKEAALWYAVNSPDGTGWSEPKRIPDQHSNAAPAIAVFNDRLYCVYMSSDGPELRCITFDGTSWSKSEKIPGQKTSTGPGLAVFNDTLYCVYQASDDNPEMYWITFDGTSWSSGHKMDGKPGGYQKCHREPALAVYRDELHCVYRTNEASRDLYHTRFDGTTWDEGFKIEGKNKSDDGPGLVVYRDKLHCVFRSSDSSENLYHMSYDGSWGYADKLDHVSSQGPGLIAHRDPETEEDQILCVHRGGS